MNAQPTHQNGRFSRFRYERAQPLVGLAIAGPMGCATSRDFLFMASAIDVLRSDEGSSITFICDNPDFNGQPNAKVICNGAWTNWADREFTGATVREAVLAAMAENERLQP